METFCPVFQEGRVFKLAGKKMTFVKLYRATRQRKCEPSTRGSKATF